jgi:hypothetical protein
MAWWHRITQYLAPSQEDKDLIEAQKKHTAKITDLIFDRDMHVLTRTWRVESHMLDILGSHFENKTPEFLQAWTSQVIQAFKPTHLESSTHAYMFLMHNIIQQPGQYPQKDRCKAVVYLLSYIHGIEFSAEEFERLEQQADLILKETVDRGLPATNVNFTNEFRTLWYDFFPNQNTGLTTYDMVFYIDEILSQPIHNVLPEVHNKAFLLRYAYISKTLPRYNEHAWQQFKIEVAGCYHQLYPNKPLIIFGNIRNQFHLPHHRDPHRYEERVTDPSPTKRMFQA